MSMFRWLFGMPSKKEADDASLKMRVAMDEHAKAAAHSRKVAREGEEQSRVLELAAKALQLAANGSHHPDDP